MLKRPEIAVIAVAAQQAQAQAGAMAEISKTTENAQTIDAADVSSCASLASHDASQSHIATRDTYTPRPQVLAQVLARKRLLAGNTGGMLQVSWSVHSALPQCAKAVR